MAERETGSSGVAAYLVARVKELGGECDKIAFEGKRGAPDYLTWVPQWESARLIETKSPTGRVAPHQIRTHKRLNKMGLIVYTAFTKDQIDSVLAEP